PGERSTRARSATGRPRVVSDPAAASPWFQSASDALQDAYDLLTTRQRSRRQNRTGTIAQSRGSGGRGCCRSGRRRQRRLDRGELLLTVRGGEEPRLEHARWQGDALLAHRVEERRVAERFLGLRLRV